MKRTIIILSILSPALVFGQGTSSGVSVLKIPFNALEASLGAGVVAVSEDLSAAGMNPASMLFPDDRLSLLFTHAAWIEGSSSNHLSVTMPAPVGRIYLSTGMHTIPGIEVRTQPGPPSSTFSARTAVISGGWGMPVAQGILFAFSASYIYDRLYDVEATGIGLSAGILSSGILEGLTLGASVRDLGSVSGYRAANADLPTRVTIGGTYHLDVGTFTLAPAVGWQSARNGSSGLHVGGSIGYEFFSIRGVIRTGQTAQRGSIGAAVTYMGLAVEYALVPLSSGLGSGHIVSIRVDL